jgi:Sel1 repeat
MKRLVLAILCSVTLLAPAGALADQAFDQDMAGHYLRAAQSGDDEAQFYLGSLYSAGIGVPRSDPEAFRWFARAANQGHSHAMLIVAGLYATARGVARNNVEAYKWAYIVNGASRVEQFRDGSRQLMGLLEIRMSPQDVTLAKAAAGSWRAVVAPRPAQAPPPAADYSRAAPPVPAAQTPVVATAAPAPAPNPQPSAKLPSDMESFLKEVPALRKRFGF